MEHQQPRRRHRLFVTTVAIVALVSCNCFLTTIVARRVIQHFQDRHDRTTGGDTPVTPPEDDDNATAERSTSTVATRRRGHVDAAVLPASLLCGSAAVCQRMDVFFQSKTDEDQDPCEDFYGYVCSRWRNNWAVGATPRDAPLTVQGTAKLMFQLQKALGRYFAIRQRNYRDYPGVFLNQAIFFLPNCTSIYSRNGLGWDPWQDLLRKMGLEGWPFLRKAAGSNVSAVTANVDAMLGVFPFVQVRVKREYEPCCAVQLDTPVTVFKRHALWHPGEDAHNYTLLVTKALSLLGMLPDQDVLAQNIVILEMRLEDALGFRRAAVPATGREADPDVLPHSKAKWHWPSYLARVLAEGGSGDKYRPISVTEVLDNEYLSDLAEIMDNTSCTTLFNYIGYRTLVQLAPLLPDDASFLVPLSHDDPVKGVPERLQACVHLLERLFPFGTRIFLRMSMDEDNPLRYMTHLDQQLEKTFNETRDLLSRRVVTARWLNPVERVIAKEKLFNMEFVFMGTVMDLNVPAAYYNPSAPQFLGSQLVKSYVDIQVNTRSIYYNPWSSGRAEWDLDNRFHMSSLRPGYEYVSGRNVLYVPYGTVAFLKGLSRAVDPVFVPMVAPFIMRGIFEALDDRGSSVDHRRRVREWWSKPSFNKFFAIKDCIFKQHKVAMEKLTGKEVDVLRDLEDLVADTAVMDPLYEYYLSRLSLDPSDARQRRSAVGGFTYEQLFFVAYTSARCDGRGSSYEKRRIDFGEVPSRVAVNVVLRNEPRFAKAFGCQAGHEMSPGERCSVW